MSSFLTAQSKGTPLKEPSPDVPDAIQAPAGEEVVLYAHASGSQIYTCHAAANGKFSWTLKAPEAELHVRKDKVIGQHSAGPTWKLKDGSEVTGKMARLLRCSRNCLMQYWKYRCYRDASDA